LIPKSLKSVGYAPGIFQGCTSLKNVTFAEGTTWIGPIFYNCTSLEQITIPDTVTKIGSYAFYGCSNLKSVNIPDSVTEIGSYAFQKCTKLKTVDFPNTLTTIGSYAFAGCDNLIVSCNYYSEGVIFCIDNGIPFLPSDQQLIDSANRMIEKSETSFYANTNAINANGTLPFTVKWNAKRKWRGELSNQEIVVYIPKYTDLEEDTIRLNGAVVSDYRYNSNTRRLSIPVDDNSATVTYSVSLRDKEKIVCYAYVTAYKEGKYTRETIGAINEDFSGISLSVPDVVNSSSVNVSGITTPSTSVQIYVYDKLQKTIRSMKTGTYSEDISIDDPKDGYPYLFEARGVDEYGNEISASQEVTYEEMSPNLTSLLLDYKESATDKEIDLIHTNGTKPLVYYAPNCEFVFKAKFENDSKIDKVYITSTKSGEKKSLEAKYDANSEMYVTSGYFDESNTGYVPGVIGVEYTKESETAKVTTSYDFAGAKSMLNESIQNAPIKYDKNTEEEVIASIDLSSTFKNLADASIDTTIQYVDMKAGSSMGDILDEMGFTLNAYSYIVPGIDDSKYILNAEKKDFGYILMVTNDVAKAGDKIAVARLEMTDELSDEFTKVFDSSTKWSNISKGIGVAYNTYGIYKDYYSLVDEINQSPTIKDKAQARQKASELRDDQIMFMLAMTVLPVIVAGTGGAVMPAASLIFSGLLSAMSATSGLFYDMRIAQIKGEKFRLNWVIDPSGYVYDAGSGEKIEGALVTAYWLPYDGSDNFWKNKPSFSNYGTKWDASEYEQINGLFTNADGKYAWDVPEGWWRVKSEKDGYDSEWTDWMSVPPVQTDVNIGMYKVGQRPTNTSDSANVNTNTNITSNLSGSGSGNTNSQASQSKTIKKVTAPAKSKISSVKNSKKKTIVAKWKKVKGAKGYEVQYALNKKFTKSKKSKTTGKLTLTVKKLKKGKTYYVRVRAYKTDGNGNKVYGKWSAIKKVKVKK
ncbi:MAG: fibronectin type III domain-containing protein, partial [Lachnospiraceae bacterium]|nr:fibronectin type III domain-containing protein [Lachnospiraceae bacterium]